MKPKNNEEEPMTKRLAPHQFNDSKDYFDNIRRLIEKEKSRRMKAWLGNLLSLVIGVATIFTGFSMMWNMPLQNPSIFGMFSFVCGLMVSAGSVVGWVYE